MNPVPMFFEGRFKGDIIFAGTFIVFASYIVLGYELDKDRLFYFLFQTSLYNIFVKLFDPAYVKLWFSNFNRIVFPLAFWFVSILFLFIRNFVSKSSFGRENVFHAFQKLFIFHIFLLILKHQALPYFWVFDLPGNISPGKVIPGFDQAAIAFFLTLYYFVACISFSKYIEDKGEWWELVPAFSIVIPFLYSKQIFLHLFLVVGGMLLFFVRSSIKNRNIKWNENIFPVAILTIIFLLGLYFRLEYADFFATNWNKLKLLSADGLSYYNSAFAFSVGHPGGEDFWRTPIYWLYLSIFFKLSSLSPRTLFIAQAILGSLTPIIIFLILRELGLKKIGMIAAFLIAVSHFCIHNSVVLNRAALQMTTITLLIYFALTIKKEINFKIVGLGFLVGINFYLGLETLPIELFTIGYVFWSFVKDKLSSKIYLRLIGGFLIGFLVSIAPVNIVFHSISSKWIPLGRDFSKNSSSEIWKVYINEKSISQLKDLGFIPGDKLIKNARILSREPVQAAVVLLTKFWIEFKGFWLDPSPYYLAPLHLLEGSFFGANVEFYSYFFTLCGCFVFIFRLDIQNRNKVFIFAPIFLQAFSVCIAIYGVYRFRAPIVPLIFIFTAVGVSFLLFPNKENKLENETN